MFDIKGSLKSKKLIADRHYLLEFELSEPMTALPGQKIQLKFNEEVKKPYSIAELDGAKLKLFLSTRPGGVASELIKNVEVGETYYFNPPSGKFVYDSEVLKGKNIFITTGTGLAPVLPMLKEAIKNGDNYELWYGHREEEDYLDELFSEFGIDVEPSRITVFSTCTNDLDSIYNVVNDRVTAYNKYKAIIDYKTTNFILCGNPYMVNAMLPILENNNAKIMREKYGKTFEEKALITN